METPYKTNMNLDALNAVKEHNSNYDWASGDIDGKADLDQGTHRAYLMWLLQNNAFDVEWDWPGVMVVSLQFLDVPNPLEILIGPGGDDNKTRLDLHLEPTDDDNGLPDETTFRDIVKACRKYRDLIDTGLSAEENKSRIFEAAWA